MLGEKEKIIIPLKEDRPPRPIKIGVVGVPGGYSSEKLADALAALTGFRCLIDPSQFFCDLTRGTFSCNGLDLADLDGLVIKKLGPTYAPHLLDRLDLLAHLANKGVKIFSRPQNISRVINRLSCTLILAEAGFPLPPTIITEDFQAAAKAVASFGRAVLKPLFSSKAKGMMVLEDGPGVKDALLDYQAAGNNLFYIQKYLDLGGRDFGLAFLGGEYLAAYARVGRAGSWNTSTSSGGVYSCYQPNREMIDLAQRAQNLFGLDFTSVDVAETAQGPVIFEVSAFGGFRGLKEGCGLDAAEHFARYIIDNI
ncbi:MAG: GAK system ATP-grasp enzyme [Deltaproteobacteria bacterium]|nr:GAK system ATP-grasp enzyme [Deltaproteobacteria bacterium]